MTDDLQPARDVGTHTHTVPEATGREGRSIVTQTTTIRRLAHLDS